MWANIPTILNKQIHSLSTFVQSDTGIKHMGTIVQRDTDTEYMGKILHLQCLHLYRHPLTLVWCTWVQSDTCTCTNTSTYLGTLVLSDTTGELKWKILCKLKRKGYDLSPNFLPKLSDTLCKRRGPEVARTSGGHI